MTDLANSSIELNGVDSNLFDCFFDQSLDFINNETQLPSWYQTNVATELITARMDTALMAGNYVKSESQNTDTDDPSSPEPITPNTVNNYMELQQAAMLQDENEHSSVKDIASTEDLDNYSKLIQSKRPLSQEEELLLKRQRRLIKNRESAQKSRLRKKKYVEELEQRVQHLKDDNLRLDCENRALREDVGYLSTIIRQTPNISNDVLKGVARKSAYSSSSAKAAGVCLLIVLFSFGLFFNNKTGTRGLALPIEVSNPIEAGSTGDNSRSSRGYAGRLLRSIRGSIPGGHTAEEIESMAEGTASLEQYFALQSSGTKRKRENEEDASDTDSFQVKKHVKPPLKKIKIEKTEDEEDLSLVPLSEASPVPSSDPEISSPGQGTSYIFCSDARELFMNEQQERMPRTLSFLMPTDPNNFLNSDPNSQSLLEVSCQVVNMNVYSANSGMEPTTNFFNSIASNIEFGNKELVSSE